jgi:hypothetical protein
MATFIPEWTRATRRELELKRALDRLDDDWVVRRPLGREEGTPALLLQHPRRGWLALEIDASPFAALDPQRLFRDDDAAAFDRTLAALGGLEERAGVRRSRLPKVVLLWSCSRSEARRLARPGVLLVGRPQLTRWGADLLARLAAPLHPGDEEALRGRLFPEAEIPPACTLRRPLSRDNSARLTRFFLDRDQEWASKIDLEPPAEQAALARNLSVRLVNGVAGSGKTLIALQRARLLAELFPGQRFLLLIFNTPIVADIQARLRRAGRRQPPNLEITTFYRWAVEQWRAVFGTPPRASSSVQDLQLIQQLMAQGGGDGALAKLSPGQLRSELELIDDALVASEDEYLAASRTGRGFALRPAQRSAIWRLSREVNGALAAQGLRMWSRLPAELCRTSERARLATYHQVLIDEAQFFARSWFELVRMSLAPRGTVFLCADPNQGFLGRRLSWKGAGWEVAGRTRRLRRSYRTTRAILAAANRLLAGAGEEDPEEFLQPDFSGMEAGTPPLLAGADSPQDAVDRVTNEIAAALAGGRLAPSDVLVIFGGRISRELLYRRLCAAVGANRVWWLNREEDKKRPPGGAGDHLRMASLETATGLEAPVVFLVGVEGPLAACARPPLGATAEEAAQAQGESARKLYMAMTRAGQRLIVVSTEPVPAALAGIFQPLP